MNTEEFIKMIKDIDKRLKAVEKKVNAIYLHVFPKKENKTGKKGSNTQDARDIARGLMEGIDHFLGTDKK